MFVKSLYGFELASAPCARSARAPGGSSPCPAGACATATTCAAGSPSASASSGARRPRSAPAAGSGVLLIVTCAEPKRKNSYTS